MLDISSNTVDDDVMQSKLPNDAVMWNGKIDFHRRRWLMMMLLFVLVAGGVDLFVNDASLSDKSHNATNNKGTRRNFRLKY